MKSAGIFKAQYIQHADKIFTFNLKHTTSEVRLGKNRRSRGESLWPRPTGRVCWHYAVFGIKKRRGFLQSNHGDG